MTRRLLVLIFVVVGLTSSYGQKEAVTRDAFAAAYSSAEAKAREFPRIHNSESIQFSEGVPYNTLTWKWAFAGPYRHRLIFEQKKSDGSLRVEWINLEDKNFCKIDGGSWTQTTGTCPVRVPWMVTQMSYMMNASALSEFFVESVEVEGQRLKKYSEQAKLGKRTTPAGKDISPSSYESTFWIDSTGRIVRQEYKHKSTQPTRVTSTWIDTFTYLQKLNIEPPIK